MYCNKEMSAVLTQPEVATALLAVHEHITKAQVLLAKLSPEVQRVIALAHEDNDGTDYSLMRTLRGAASQVDELVKASMP